MRIHLKSSVGQQQPEPGLESRGSFLDSYFRATGIVGWGSTFPSSCHLSYSLLRLPICSSESEHEVWPDSPGWFLFEGLLVSNFHFCYSVLWHVVLRAEGRLGIKDKSTVTGAPQHGDTAASVIVEL